MSKKHIKSQEREMKQKSFKLIEPSVSEEGVIKAYVSIFGNVDSYGEVVVPGAFTDSLQKKLPKGVWHHDWKQPIAVTTLAEEHMAGDPRLPESIRHLGGLYIEGKLVKGVQKADEAFLLMKAGAIDEFSIGYFLEEWEEKDDDILYLKKISLFEWSPVLVGANDMTVLMDVKQSVVPFVKHGKAPDHESFNAESEIEACKGNGGLLKEIGAWYDPKRKEAKLVHHRASDKKESLLGVVSAMTSLLRGESGVPEDHRKSVYRHLAKHYKEFGKKAPAFQEYSKDDLNLIAEGKEPVSDAVKSIIESHDEKTVRRAVKALTEALKALTEPDTPTGKASQKGRKLPRKKDGNKKYPVKKINRAIHALLKIKKL